jgi:hypothetical protein
MVDDDVHPVFPRDLEDLRCEGPVTGLDDVVCAVSEHRVVATPGSRRPDDPARPEVPGEPHADQTHPGRCGVDEHRLTGLQTTDRPERVVLGQQPHDGRGPLDVAPVAGNGDGQPGVDHDLLGQSTAGQGHHAVAGLKALDTVADLEHVPRGVQPRDDRRRADRSGRSMRARPLREVGTIDRCGAYRDPDLLRPEGRFRDVGHGQRAAVDARLEHDGTHLLLNPVREPWRTRRLGDGQPQLGAGFGG